MNLSMTYIYEIYKERSFSQAAKNLYISQPALSAYIKKTEKELAEQLEELTNLERGHLVIAGANFFSS